MKRMKTISLICILFMTMIICSCGKNSEEIAVETEAVTTIITEPIPTETTTGTSVSEVSPEAEDVITEQISDEQAIEAIRNYCCTINPDLENIAAEEYPVYWEIISSDSSEIVVLFRSYTGAQVRYYVERATGITTITEFVPGIMDEEEPTGESINVRDYIN